MDKIINKLFGIYVDCMPRLLKSPVQHEVLLQLIKQHALSGNNSWDNVSFTATSIALYSGVDKRTAQSAIKKLNELEIIFLEGKSFLLNASYIMRLAILHESLQSPEKQLEMEEAFRAHDLEALYALGLEKDDERWAEEFFGMLDSIGCAESNIRPQTPNEKLTMKKTSCAREIEALSQALDSIKRKCDNLEKRLAAIGSLDVQCPVLNTNIQ